MGQKGKPRRANGEGTLEWIEKEQCYRIRLSVRTPEGEKRKTFKAKRQRDVIKKRDGFLRETDRGRRGLAPARTTLSEYLSDWLHNSARANVGEHTFERYEQAVQIDLIPLLGDVKLREVSAPDVRYLKSTLLDAGKAPGTASYVQGVLSTALNQAVADGLIHSNPCRLVKKAKDREKRMRPLTEEQAAALVTVVSGTRYEAFYMVASKLGPRQGELAGLFWTDFDLDSPRPTMTVQRSVDTHRAGSRWGTTKTGEGRTIRLPGGVTESLRRHKIMQNAEQLAASSWEDPRLVFPNQRGGVHRRNSVMRLFHNHLEEAALPRIRFHDLRHTAATLMLKNGVDVSTAAHVLGPKDPAMTLRRYAHVLGDMTEAAAARMDSYAF
jgi:integrase